MRKQIILLLVILLACKCTKNSNEEVQSNSLENAEPVESVEIKEETIPNLDVNEFYLKLSDYPVKWIYEDFYKKLAETRSLEEALEITDTPILVFHRGHDSQKNMELHRLYTLLQFVGTNVCLYPIKQFTASGSVYEATLETENARNECMWERLTIQPIFDNEQVIQKIKITAKNGTDEYQNTYIGKMEGLVEIVNELVLAGTYEDDSGNKYSFQKNKIETDIAEGEYDNFFAFQVLWDDVEYKYQLNFNKESKLLLEIYDIEKGIHFNYVCIRNAGGIELHDLNTGSILRLKDVKPENL